MKIVLSFVSRVNIVMLSAAVMLASSASFAATLQSLASGVGCGSIKKSSILPESIQEDGEVVGKQISFETVDSCSCEVVVTVDRDVVSAICENAQGEIANKKSVQGKSSQHALFEPKRTKKERPDNIGARPNLGIVGYKITVLAWP
jgi:hypothetical protein